MYSRFFCLIVIVNLTNNGHWFEYMKLKMYEDGDMNRMRMWKK